MYCILFFLRKKLYHVKEKPFKEEYKAVLSHYSSLSSSLEFQVLLSHQTESEEKNRKRRLSELPVYSLPFFFLFCPFCALVCWKLTKDKKISDAPN